MFMSFLCLIITYVFILFEYLGGLFMFVFILGLLLGDRESLPRTHFTPPLSQWVAELKFPIYRDLAAQV